MKATGAPEVFEKTATLLAAEPFGAVPEGAGLATFGMPGWVATTEAGGAAGATGAEATDGFGKPVDARLGLDDDEPAVTVTMTVTGEQVLPVV